MGEQKRRWHKRAANILDIRDCPKHLKKNHDQKISLRMAQACKSYKKKNKCFSIGKTRLTGALTRGTQSPSSAEHLPFSCAV